MKKFVVIDDTGNISYGFKRGENDASPESFSTKAAADKRAADLAEHAPGMPIYICQVVAEVVAPVGKVTVKPR